MNVIIKRSRRKSVAIKIENNGYVKIMCPYRLSMQKINEILQEKHSWLESSLAKIEKKFIENKQIYNYNQLLFLGHKYDIIVEKNILKIGEHRLEIKKNNIPLTLKDWLVKQANALLLKELNKLSKETSIEYVSSKIISARKRWGSCDSKKNIKLNFRLIMLPIECIKYVCVHELCHIKHMNHSKQFYNEVLKYFPNYKEIVKMMKTFSYALELF